MWVYDWWRKRCLARQGLPPEAHKLIEVCAELLKPQIGVVGGLSNQFVILEKNSLAVGYVFGFIAAASCHFTPEAEYENHAVLAICLVEKLYGSKNARKLIRNEPLFKNIKFKEGVEMGTLEFDMFFKERINGAFLSLMFIMRGLKT